MSAFCWTLAYLPVSTNGLYPTRVLPGGKMIRFLDSRAKRWKAETQQIVWLSRVRAPGGHLSLRLDVFPPDRRNRDTDGTIKLAQDAICAALDIDDSRIAHLDVWRHRPEPTNARIEASLGIVDPIEIGWIA